jgi:hypothetical protein
MALVLADRVKETTTTTGTGTLTLAGAATGFQPFSVIGNGNTTYYAISSSGGSQWEVGIGTYTSSGTTLARTTILASSNSGSAVNLSAGTKDVFVTLPSAYGIATATTVSDTTNSSTGAFQVPQGTTAQRPGTPTNGMIRINTSTNVFEIYSTNNSSWNTLASFSNTVTSVEYMVVAGGGGAASGGAGAGGYRAASGFAVTAGVSITVTVGAGGTGVVSSGGSLPTAGSTSTFSTINSSGGGRGGQDTANNASTGGSGGGGGASNGVTTGAAGNSGAYTPVEGFAGGGNATFQGSPYPAGGGGGSSAAGQSATGASTAGNGGAGTANSIGGTSVTYAGGGGGAVYGGGTAGTGGAGGGGAGNGSGNGTAGTANTGGGGGGGSVGAVGGNGGSGIVIVRYADTFAAATSTTGGPTINVAGGYRVYTWTSSGTITI